VRLGRRPDPVSSGLQRGRRQCQHAPLAVRAADQGAAHGELRIAERAKERPRAAEAEPDPEPAPVRERVERRLVRQRGHGAVTRE
jgi:hypothetical protein